MAQAADGFQTGFELFPSVVAMNPTQGRTVLFGLRGGVTPVPGVVFSLGSGAAGTINAASGLYTGPASVASPRVDQVLATAPDGSQSQGLVYLS